MRAQAVVESVGVAMEQISIRMQVRDGKPAVTSLQVAESFGKEHRNVLADIRKILETDEDGFGALNFQQSSYLSEQNKEFPMYVMTRDGFVLLVMGYTGPGAMRVKKAYIARFNEMERELAVPALPNFRNPAEAARAWADKEEQRAVEEQRRLALEQRVEEMKPKVVFAESIEVAKTSILVGEMAKLIKQATGYDIGQNRFFEWLRNRGYLHKSGSQTNMPTQRCIDNGWMEIKEGTRLGSGGESRITRTPKITGKGQIYFINLFKRLAES